MVTIFGAIRRSGTEKEPGPLGGVGRSNVAPGPARSCSGHPEMFLKQNY